MAVLLAIVEPQAVHTLSYADVMLVEDRRPLHGSPVQFLAGCAMADLRIYGVGADLVLNGIAVTTCPIFCSKIGI